ncbi:zinc carboxypeptidase domain-containing protein [Phthorimaea operculella]|nr:zinc carboxypeptidase domain-containing protein [Phthorimaea operculella]
MRNCVFLILLLGFIRVILSCSQSKENHTEDVCTVSWFRRKRANTEYTRWRFNTETTPEFIVKVLDDDLPVGTTRRVTAVNILPSTTRAERIIVGGAEVTTTTKASSVLPRDYTRFMPPTRKVTATGRSILPFIEAIEPTTANPSNLIQPIFPEQTTEKVIQPPFFPPNPVRPAQRDESPPVNPLFVHRPHAKDVVPPRQYAPVAPVVFTRITTGTPLKPPAYTEYIGPPDPTRTTENVPLRTENFLEKLKNFDDLSALEVEIQIPSSRSEPNVVVSVEEPIINQSKQDSVTRRREPICNMIKLRSLDFNSPRTLPEIVAQLKQWTEESPMAKWDDITGGNLTTMENPIYVMIVDDPGAGQVASEKHNVLLIAGISGRDHHAVSAAMFILYQLIERSESHHDLLSKFRFYVIPVFNPDGYDYSLTFPHRREWVKNLRQNWDPCQGHPACMQCHTHGLRCTVAPCYGVNLDRNFDYQWIPPTQLKMEQECGTLYAGTRQMSEVETQALNTYLHQQPNLAISTFIAFKEGDVLGVMYPYSHTKKRRAFDQIFRYRAGRAANAANGVSGRKYVAGQTSEFLPLYAGGIEDWADGHLGIDDTYTVMLSRPVDTPKTNILIEKVIHEGYAAMDSLLLSSLTDAGGRGAPMALVKNVIPLAGSRLQPNVLAVSLTLVPSLFICYLFTRIL